VLIGDYLIPLMLRGEQLAILRFLMAIYKQFKAVLDVISSGSLVFTFLHATEESAQHMMDDRDKVKKLIEDFLEELDASVLYDHLELCVHMQIDGKAVNRTVDKQQMKRYRVHVLTELA